MNKKNRIVSFAWLSVLVLLLGSKASSQDTIFQDTTWEAGTYTYNDVWVARVATLTFNGSVTLNCTTLDLNRVLFID
jgi:hypothetical protein